jgi:cystathionine beta-synthase
VARLLDRDEVVAESVRRLRADGLGEDDVVLVAYHREGRVLPPHPSDILGWTTLARLRGAATIAEVVRPAGPRLGTGLALTDPAVSGWDRADGEVALVLDGGRVTGSVTWTALHRATASGDEEDVA